MNVGGFELNLADLATLITSLVTLAGLARVRGHQNRKAGQLDEVAHEVKPNGGASLRDAVDRIERNLADVVAKVDANTARIVVIEQRATRRRWRR